MDLEKAMQFTIERLARLEAAAAKHDEQIAQNAARIACAADLIGRLAQSGVVLTERMDKGFQEVREILPLTHDKLKALIDTVDKHLCGATSALPSFSPN